MEEYKKKLRNRLLSLTAGLICASAAIVLSRFYSKAPQASANLQDFIKGFQVGIVAGLLGFLSVFIVKCILAMRNPTRLKKLYISETDERKSLIMQKSGSIGMNIIMYSLAVATTVSGNINETVFFTLLGTCIFVASIRGFLKLYYRNKY